ncbi:hypothetical protein AAC387_Pa01g1496 [Persea americana]
MNKLLVPIPHLIICTKTIPIRSFHSNSTIYDLIFHSLQDPDSVSDLKRIHTLVITNGLLSKSVLACRLIKGYSFFSHLRDARKLFDGLPKPTVHSYNYMLKPYIDQGHHELVLALYYRMLSSVEILPDCLTYSFVIRACGALSAMRSGKLVHGHVLVNGLEPDLHLATGIIDFYSKCGLMDDARRVFDRIVKRDVFVWTAMIHGYLQIGDYVEALSMFSNMKDMGLKASIVTWNAMIAGFVRGGLVSDALREFNQMQVEGVRPDKVSLSTILPMFSRFAILKSGLEAHAYIIRMGFEFDLFVISSLVDMYAKCGRLQLAQYLFDQVRVKDTGLWNAMIVGYGIHGHGKEALRLFHQMQVSDVRPNGITFTSIISACSHAGMVDEGRRCFNLMVSDYGIIPYHEHYACMVDMFGRAGQLEEAYEFIKSLPIDPMKDVWGAFLGACRNHQNWKLADIAAQHVFACKDIGKDAGYHVVMSNIYAETGRWSDVAKLRTSIRDGGLKKKTGFSWIEVGDAVHTFYTADKSHPQSDYIYALLSSFEADDYPFNLVETGSSW